MNNTLPKTAIIILAAGASNRMGRIKQLLPWKHTTLIGNSIEQALASTADDIFVVLGSNYKLVSKEIETYNITILNNQNWPQGMGSSISCTIDYLNKNTKKYSAVLMMLSDQPLIDVIYINKLIDNSIKYNIIASKYKNRSGVPAIFSSKYFDELGCLNGDIGARELLVKLKNDVKVMDAFDKVQDVDSLDSYNKLYQKYGRTS